MAPSRGSRRALNRRVQRAVHRYHAYLIGSPDRTSFGFITLESFVNTARTAGLTHVADWGHRRYCDFSDVDALLHRKELDRTEAERIEQREEWVYFDRGTESWQQPMIYVQDENGERVPVNRAECKLVIEEIVIKGDCRPGAYLPSLGEIRLPPVALARTGIGRARATSPLARDRTRLCGRACVNMRTNVAVLVIGDVTRGEGWLCTYPHGPAGGKGRLRAKLPSTSSSLAALPMPRRAHSATLLDMHTQQRLSAVHRPTSD
jgi:hypothetical protein